MTIYIFLSTISLAVSVFFYKRSRSNIGRSLIFLCLFITSGLFYGFYYVSNFFTGQGINDAVIYHLRYGLEGSGFGQYSQLIIILSLFILLFISLVYWVFFIKNKKEIKFSFLLGFIFILISIITNPASINLYTLFVSSAIKVPVAMAKENQEIEADLKVNFDHFYKEPSINKNVGSKNLVFIYLEGLEQTYSDENLFPGLTKGLNKIQGDATYFTNIRQTYGADYTIAGIVASQCGIPLLPPFHGNSMFGMDEFLPSAVCMSDLLHQEGYYLVYQGGANLDFSGKGKFYKTHSFDEVRGLNELLPEIKDDSIRSSWGIFDDDLLDLSYKKFIELSEKKEKMALFLLTLDTHHPGGLPTPACKDMVYQDGYNDILNAVACTDKLVSEFVTKIQNSVYGKNTLIVIASDHLALRNTASDLLEKKERTNRLIILEPGKKGGQKVVNFGTTLDIGPTVLSFMGYEGFIGLGGNLVEKNYNEDEKKYVYKHIGSWRSDMYKFFDFPKIESAIVIKILEKKILIDKRSFGFPALIELDKDLNTNLKFEFNVGESNNLLVRMQDLDENTPFLLIDDCTSVKTLYSDLRDGEYCLAIGSKDKIYYANNVDSDIEMNVDQIKQFTNIP